MDDQQDNLQNLQIVKLTEQIEIMNKILLGNGNPDNSIVLRMARLEDTVKVCQTHNGQSITAITAALDKMRDTHIHTRREKARNTTAIICSLIALAGTLAVVLFK